MKEFVKTYWLRILVVILVLSTIIISLNFVNKKEYKDNWAEKELERIHSDTDDMYDVIVLGGDPEGIAAAVASARAGAKVLLLSYEDGLGGLMTYGWLNSIDMNYNPAHEIITKGIFLEFYNKLGGDSFDTAHAKQIFTEMINNEKNITYIPSIGLIGVEKENNTIKGISFGVNGIPTVAYGRRFIDASQDGDLMSKAGVEYTYGQEDMGVTGVKMAVTLCFKVDGVNWDLLKKDIENLNETTGTADAGINDKSAWGFGTIYEKYTPIHENMRLRGLNIGKQNDGSILINALQIFAVDALDPSAKARAKEKGAIEAENIVKFLKEYLPSFENAEFGGAAPELYVRETRHIQGEYVLQVMDVLENRDFDDKIALGSYPLDVQATSKTNTGYVMGNPANYSIPMRCIVPLGLENAYIVGRSASYTSLAASTARVIPVGMCTGQAAGIASVYSIINDVTPREICKNEKMVKDVQKIITDQGGYLTLLKVANKYEGHWAYPSARKLITLGLLVIGYDNQIDFDEVSKTDLFCNILLNATTRMGHDLTKVQRDFIAQYYGGGDLKIDHIARIAIYILTGENIPKENAFETAKEKGLIPETILQKVNSGDIVTKDITYYMSVYILESLTGEEMRT